MDKIEFYNESNKNIERIDADEAIVKLYYDQNLTLPTDEQLKKFKIKKTQSEIKYELSRQDKYIPLYDVYTSNIYIINKRNVYHRVITNNYRFPDIIILEAIEKDKKKRDAKIGIKPELKNDKVFMRYLKKIDLMLKFMSYFDLDILYNTYLAVFFKYAPEISNATYTCIRKSFIHYLGHLNPYYSKDEVIKLGMNMGIVTIPKDKSYIDFKDELQDNDYKNLCQKVKENDVSADILIEHEKYIIKHNCVGLVQYYTLQGSFFMNQYMRRMTKYLYQNNYLEKNIRKMWELVRNAPAFDNDYILYRFVDNDTYISHLKIDDIFMDEGFVSTTRDPFYRTDNYKFGSILMRIRIPKDIIGVGLCLETLSHFKAEEEIILPPMTMLKLISKDDDIEYYHPDEEFASQIKRKYEFKWVGNEAIKFPKRAPFDDNKTHVINFLELEPTKTFSMKEKINLFASKYFDPMSRIKCQIGDKLFYVIGEYYDSTGVYKNMYGITTSEGFSLYSIYEGYILFMMELGEENGNKQIRVNYFTKYSQLKRDDIMGDDNFIRFVSDVSYYFDIPNVIIYADFLGCDGIELSIKNENQSGGKVQRLLNSSLKQMDLIKKPNLSNSNNLDNLDNSKKLNEDDFDEYVGGSYCIDFYRYLKHNVKRYENTSALHVELQPKFSYYELDQLKITSPEIILKKEDRDEIYQIYTKTFNDLYPDKDNLAEFYIWMIENKCYLMDILIAKFDRMFKKDNPFKKNMYILDSMTYLYNRGLVSTYNRHIMMEFDEDVSIYDLPKNDYRIQRD